MRPTVPQAGAHPAARGPGRGLERGRLGPVAGTGPVGGPGTGPVGTGPAGTGPVGTGPAGTGPAGTGPAGIRPDNGPPQGAASGEPAGQRAPRPSQVASPRPARGGAVRPGSCSAAPAGSRAGEGLRHHVRRAAAPLPVSSAHGHRLKPGKTTPSEPRACLLRPSMAPGWPRTGTARGSARSRTASSWPSSACSPTAAASPTTRTSRPTRRGAGRAWPGRWSGKRAAGRSIT